MPLRLPGAGPSHWPFTEPPQRCFLVNVGRYCKSEKFSDRTTLRPFGLGCLFGAPRGKGRLLSATRRHCLNRPTSRHKARAPTRAFSFQRPSIARRAFTLALGQFLPVAIVASRDADAARRQIGDNRAVA